MRIHIFLMSSSEQVLYESATKRRRLLNYVKDEDQSLGTLPDDRLENMNQAARKLDFEEAIRMATSNKINSKNTWDFALIDYFHDMNLLRGRDGTSINFQKAGATLDSCMKIFSHRIDSIVADTGRLLSGLNQRNATSGGSKSGNDISQEENTIENIRKRAARNKKPKLTLQDSFHDIKIRHYDQALNVDPLFKKAIAEFDEGGAKSLLMNVLKINSKGLIVFDETLSKSLVSTPFLADDDETRCEPDEASPDTLKNVQEYLSMHNFNASAEFKSATICRSMGSLVSALDDTDTVNTFIDSILQPQETGKNVNAELDLNDPANVEEPRELLSDENDDGHQSTDKHISAGSDDFVGNEYEIEKIDKEALSALDSSNPNWSGSNTNSWKVELFKRKIGNTLRKELMKSDPNKGTDEIEVLRSTGSNTLKGGKHHAVIDFTKDFTKKEERTLFRKGKKKVLRQPKLDNKVCITLPDDLRWNSERLLSLFDKPDSKINVFRKRSLQSTNENTLTNAAGNVNDVEYDDMLDAPDMEISSHNENEEDIIVDDDMQGVSGDFDFNMLFSSQDDSNGTTGLNYARASKKVDIKLLKDNMWQSALLLKNNDSSLLRLSDIIKDTLEKYKSKQRDDISTSFLFICMLHLANEHGLQMEGNEAHTDLTIKSQEEAITGS